MTRTIEEITNAQEVSTFYTTPEGLQLRIISELDGEIYCIDEETEEEYYISISELSESEVEPQFDRVVAYHFPLSLKEKFAQCAAIELDGEILSKITQDQQELGVYVFADDEGQEYEFEEDDEELLKCKFFRLQEIY